MKGLWRRSLDFTKRLGVSQETSDFALPKDEEPYDDWRGWWDSDVAEDEAYDEVPSPPDQGNDSSEAEPAEGPFDHPVTVRKQVLNLDPRTGCFLAPLPLPWAAHQTEVGLLSPITFLPPLSWTHSEVLPDTHPHPRSTPSLRSMLVSLFCPKFRGLPGLAIAGHAILSLQFCPDTRQLCTIVPHLGQACLHVMFFFASRHSSVKQVCPPAGVGGSGASP